jgi:hypothetical protein
MQQLMALWFLVLWSFVVFATSCAVPVEVKGKVVHTFSIDKQMLEDVCSHRLLLNEVPKQEWTAEESEEHADCVIEEYRKIMEVLNATNN